MTKCKHPEEQIIGVLKQVEAGRTVQEVARELGVSEATIYTWIAFPVRATLRACAGTREIPRCSGPALLQNPW